MMNEWMTEQDKERGIERTFLTDTRHQRNSIHSLSPIILENR